MLVQLYIENVAVIRKASIRLGPGLNVFTGETGAGKTILISAIDAVLGERTSREIIRTGEDRAMISALFDDLPVDVLAKLRELGYSDDEGALLITREITAAGKTGCKIGGMPATTSILREVASRLIHIHGQRDSGQLLQGEQHIRLIDAFGELDGELEQYGKTYCRLQEIREELDSLGMDDAQKAQRIDMLTFQIGEIEAAGLEDEEEEENLLARRKVIRNSEKILEGLSAAYHALTGGEDGAGIEALFDDLTDGISSVSEYIERFVPMTSRIREIGYELGEFTREIRDYLDEFEFDPQELNGIEYRLDTISKLKRKYGASISEVKSFCENARQELESIGTSDRRMEQLTAELQSVTEEAQKQADKLSAKRKKVAKEFTLQVERELVFLDMSSVKLSVKHNIKPLSRNGRDDMELLLSTNVGEPPKPLSRIASGGEIARVMLAVKNVLANRDAIPTLIFDEVDTGVSGRAAQKIGRKLKQVSEARQVIAVTHLAQVAAFADNHLLIRKEVEDGRTYTRVIELNRDGAVEELARITSGESITDIALQNAGELWRNAHEST